MQNTAQLEILDDKDQSLQAMGSSVNYAAGSTSLVLNYASGTFMRGGPNVSVVGAPRKLRCELTTEVRRMNVPFELDDLPLLPLAQEKRP
jgi:hypothetical protein